MATDLDICATEADAETPKGKSANKIDAARQAIGRALDGLSKEEACVTMATIAATLGHYDEAIRFLQLAKNWRDAVWKADQS